MNDWMKRAYARQRAEEYIVQMQHIAEQLATLSRRRPDAVVPAAPPLNLADIPIGEAKVTSRRNGRPA